MALVKNVTITLHPDVARWARENAARRDVSLSRFISEVLEHSMAESQEYEVAMRSYLGGRAEPLKKPGSRYPTREQVHER